VIGTIERAFNIKRTELAPAVLLFLYLFFAIGCYIMGQAVGDALFLTAFPTYLPQGIIATAVVVGIFTSAYIRMSHRVRLEQLIIGTLLFFASVFVIFWWLARSGAVWVYPLLYTWVYTVGALAPTMGWTLANHSLTTREARRAFGVIGAGGILGAPCAGFLTAALTRQAHVKPETLLLVIATGMVCCALCVRLLFRRRRERLAEADWAGSSASGTPKNLLQVWSLIRASRYLLLITALITIGCCATTVVGYQFKLIARQSYQGDTAGLAAFFGTFAGYVGLSSFLLQVLLTGRLLRSLGIRVTLFVMPVVFLGGSMGVLLAPVLLSAAVLRGSQGLLRYSVDKSTTELLYLPVTPPALKGQIKSFIDGFVWRMADGIGGLALLLFANPFNFSPGRMSLLNFVFLGGWIAVAYGVRREYLTVLRSAIEHRKLDPERIAAGVLDATTAELLAHSLERGGEEQALYGLSLFELGREPAWHPALRKLLDHPSAAVRQRALRLLGETRHHGVEPQVEKMLGDESPEVRAEALQYLVTHEQKDPVLLLQTASDVPAHCLQSTVAMHLARAGDPDWLAASGHILRGMISETGPEGAASRREAARALGNIPGRREFHAELSKLLEDPDDEVAEQALLSAGQLGMVELLPRIVDGLGRPRRLGATRAALAQYGDAAVETLRQWLGDPAVSLRVRRQIPKVLARIGTAPAARALGSSLIQSDPEVRYEVIKALNQIHARHPERMSTVDEDEISRMLDYELLAYYRSFQILGALDAPNGISSAEIRKCNRLVTQALRERMEQEFERVFRLLGLVYPSADIHNSYLSLTSQRPQLQANALEVLEHLLPTDLYRRLAAVADPESTTEGRLERVRRLCQTGVESGAEALRILLHSGDGWLCACALHTIGLARLTEMQVEVGALGHEDFLLDGTWRWTSGRLNGREGEKGAVMLSLLEKVDLLQNAKLFQRLPTQSLARVAAIAHELNWAPQQVVYHEGSRAESILLVLEGEVELIRGEKVLAKIGPHQVPGALAVLSNGRYSESAVVSQPTRALRMDREEFFDAMAEDFRVARGIVTALAGMAHGAA
jgi:ATP:ADP antiporter, AAA family